MKKKTWEQFVALLWERHTRPDRHGYHDRMTEQEFESACWDLLKGYKEGLFDEE